ncbi:MAG: dihydropteroate synthase [Oleiphilaceae bacterium]|nr:dihydropteroate synthase [Oleiphilaceae bacterium]
MNHDRLLNRHNRPLIMGVLNVTPDSFSDGGRHNTPEAALEHGLRMVEEGAGIIDIGGESTRPGATPVSTQQELDRVCPAIEALAGHVPLSLDTSNPAVIREGARLGVSLINDVRALRREGALQAAAETGLPVCLMHMQGEPGDMQSNPRYGEVVAEVAAFLRERLAAAQGAGMDPEQIWLDPGFGFGKSVQHNLALLDQLEKIVALGQPVLVGLSRKSMLGRITGRDVDQRLAASVAAATLAMSKGASVVRVHDVAATRDAALLVRALSDLTVSTHPESTAGSE